MSSTLPPPSSMQRSIEKVKSSACQKTYVTMFHRMLFNLLHLQGCGIVAARFFSINNQLPKGLVDHRVKEGQVVELDRPNK